MPAITLYDAYGQPVKTNELTREHAAPSLTGVRRVWDETVASGITPFRLASVLRSAAEGDHDAYLTLAEEMEEKDLHYSCELSKRKLAVSRLPITVEAFSDSPRDIELADAVRELVGGYGMRGLIKDLMDSVGKGFSVAEIIWDRSGSRWKPLQYEWRDQRFFQFDQPSRRELRLKDETDLVNGLPLAPYKFIRHIHKIKSGIPIRGGIARVAAWAWMFKNYSVKDWMAFGEVFGMPLRIGKYGASASDSDISVLKMAVANLGSDAAAVIPETMMIDLVEAGKSTGGETFFQRLADWFDAQVSRGILGQTATTQGTPGKLGNDEAQKEVRDDIRDDDAEQIEETINRDLIKPFIDLNFGHQENYPVVQIRAVENEDITALTEALAKLVPLGLRVEQSVVRDKLGLPDPDETAKTEDLLGAGTTGTGNQGSGTGKNRATAINQESEGDSPGSPSPVPGSQTAIDAFIASFTNADLQREMQTVLMPVLNSIQATGDYGGAMEKLVEIYPAMDTAHLQEMLARMIFAAELVGRLEAQKG